MGQYPYARGAFRVVPHIPLPRRQRRLGDRQGHKESIPIRNHHSDPIVSKERLHRGGKRRVDVLKSERSPQDRLGSCIEPGVLAGHCCLLRQDLQWFYRGRIERPITLPTCH